MARSIGSDIESMNTSVGSIPVEEMMVVASLVIVLYDYLLTLGSEIERFWKRKIRLTFSSFLFLANRYLTLLGYIPTTLELVNPDLNCPEVQVIIACMMLLRIYALYEHQVRSLACPLFFAMCTIIVGIMGTVKSLSTEMPAIPFHCDGGFTITAEEAHYIAGAYGGEFFFDLVIFAMTVFKTVTHQGESGFGLLTTIVRDGTVYFGVVAAVNLANILVLVLADPINCIAVGGLLNVISSISMTRLVLSLRDPKLNGDSDGDKLTSLRFEVQPTSRAIGDSSATDTHWDDDDA